VKASRGTQPIGTAWVLGGAIALAGLAMGTWYLLSHRGDATIAGARAVAAPPVHRARSFESPHFLLRSSATDAESAAVLAAVEQLHAAYARFFQAELAGRPVPGRMQLALYADRGEFQHHNTSKGWAEAFYRHPVSHAYVARNVENPYHWMLHEVTHQLNRELAGFRRVQWVEEGLASYFGTSRIVDGAMRVGDIDPDTYPVWWLPSARLSGDFARDVQVGQVIPLRELMAGGGPGIDRNVNLYYIHYWSLTHFLLEHDGGRYAAGYRRFIASPTPLDFEATVGDLETIESGWYESLLAMTRGRAAGDTAVEVIIE
jgi:hypothetical protein